MCSDMCGIDRGSTLFFFSLATQAARHAYDENNGLSLSLASIGTILGENSTMAAATAETLET